MSNNKDKRMRIANAFRAMKSIGIKDDKVKPVLKNLLKLYDKNWELIEAENYRVLADAIFEKEEAEAAVPSMKIVNNEVEDEMEEEAQATEEMERPLKRLQATEEMGRPLKRLRLKNRGGQSSSHTGVTKTPLVRPKEEPEELPETLPLKLNGSHGMAESSHPDAENTRAKQQAVTCQSPGKDKEKEPISPKSLVAQENGDPCQPSGTSGNQHNTPLRTEPVSTSHPMRLRDRVKGSVSPQISSKERRPLLGSSSHAVHLQEPRVEPGIVLSPKQKSAATPPLIKPKDEPLADDMPLLVIPIATISPEPSDEGDSPSREGISRGHYGPEPSISQSLNEPGTANDTDSLNEPGMAIDTDSRNEPGTANDTDSLNEPRNNGKETLISGECSSDLVIASLPSGEVKISLSCDGALRRPDFHKPNLEAVLKMVEDKCLTSYDNLDPNFSVVNLLKEMCQCYLKSGTESNSKSPQTTDVAPSIDLLNKSSAVDALDAKVSVTSLNRSVDSQSKADVPLPVTPPSPPHSNVIDDGSQPDKMAAGDDSETDKEVQENCAEQTNNLNTMVNQQPQVTPELIRSLHDVVDIAKGQEKVVITLVNEVNDELPPSFHYIPQNALFQNAYVNVSLARIGDNNSCSTCSGNCLSLDTPCACSHESGGEFAYTTDGLVKEELLKECVSMNRDPNKHCQFFCKECPLERSKSEDVIEPCKGHLVRKFIKECWWKCGCDKQCGNRVVQRGISRSLQVFMTPGGKGWGLRTLEDLPKGAFVCEYVGEVLTNAELFDRVLRSPIGEKHSYPVLLDADWCAEGVLKDEEALCLDATYYGNVARFINHRCYDSNMVEIPVEVETPDHHYYHLAFFTTRKVKAMEELTWDYGIDFDDHDHPIKAFRCQCGSKFCRNIKRRSRAARRW
ncbi:hypothetical protein ACJIZ3_011883 [Penstemon smallii]|uniref:Uncharacterized protein n=1 Tax=Penstemon smallii TaxID=265156 RepID=A0ABD3ULZ8_9LAMI